MHSLGAYLLDCVRNGRAIDEIPVYDIHTHMGGYHPFPVFGNGPNEILNQMDRMGVNRIIAAHHMVVFHGGADADDPVHEAMERHEGRIFGWCCPEPRLPDCGASYVECRVRQGFKGIKLHDCNGLSYTASCYGEIYELAQDRNIPILFHSDSTNYHEKFAKILEMFPRINCILAHSGAYVAHTRDTLEADIVFINEHPGVHLDLSASVYTEGYADELLRQVGSEKILFGSDMPFVSGAYSLGCIACLNCHDDDLRNMLYRNASRLFGFTD